MYSPFLDLANDFKLQALQELWHWIPGWIDQAHGEAGRMVVFRRQITLPSVPKQTVIRISADTRYKLLVNGHRVCVGPARGSDRLWFYDTVDLGPFLQVGLNTLDVLVVRYFLNNTSAWSFGRTRSPGLTLLGSIASQDISMGKGWTAALEDRLQYPYPTPLDDFLNVIYLRVCTADVDI
jgi:hypothetical protein